MTQQLIGNRLTDADNLGMVLSMSRITLKSRNATFEAILLKAANPSQTVLFATGSGGDPERHLPLLNSLVEQNCTVIAPYFERITSHMPGVEELLLRVELLLTAVDFIRDLNLPMVGVGHSIGATLLIALAGGQLWMNVGQKLSINTDVSLTKLVLFTPPTGFFQHPNALDTIKIPVQVWSGTLDTITPPRQIEILKDRLPKGVTIDFRVVDGAGHFSFMNNLPPNVSDPIKKRDEFLRDLAAEVCRFLVI